MRFLIGGILAVIVAAAAYRTRALSESGAIAAFVVGLVVFGFGGWAFALPLLTFFVSSTLLSRWRRRSKEALGYEKGGRRDSGQVLANGGIAALCALVYGLPHYWGLGGELLPHSVASHAYVLYLAALAAANADTWATEVGSAIGGRVRSIVSGKIVPIGISGGVSVAGTLALVAGSLAIAAFNILFHPASTSTSPLYAPLLGGIAGALVDSVLGATLQAQWRDPQRPERLTERKPEASTPPVKGLAWVGNDCVNLVCTATAVAVAWLLR